MKRIEDIEIMELEELEAAAMKEAAPVPEGLEGRIREVLAAAAVADGAAVAAVAEDAAVAAVASVAEGAAVSAVASAAAAAATAAATGEPPCLLEKSRPGRLSRSDEPRSDEPRSGSRSGKARSGSTVRLAAWWTALAAAAAAAIAFVLIPGRGPEPVDTFDDPYLAYAQVEATFQRISEKMAGGIDLAGETAETLNTPIEIIRKINSK